MTPKRRLIFQLVPRQDVTKTFRGEQSAEGWWITSTASFALGVKIGLGARKLSTEAKDGKPRRGVVYFDAKRKKMRRGQSIAQELPGLPGKYGFQWSYLFLSEVIAESTRGVALLRRFGPQKKGKVALLRRANF